MTNCFVPAVNPPKAAVLSLEWALEPGGLVLWALPRDCDLGRWESTAIESMHHNSSTPSAAKEPVFLTKTCSYSTNLYFALPSYFDFKKAPSLEDAVMYPLKSLPPCLPKPRCSAHIWPFSYSRCFVLVQTLAGNAHQ